MATTRLDFEVNADTTNFTARLNEMRSNISMMFGSASGDFGGAMSGLAQFGGAATAGYGMMRAGLGQQMAMGTATDPAMAYTMHQGMMQAQSTLGQELSVTNLPLIGRGPMAVAGMTPPGVGIGDYAGMMRRNLGQRMGETAAGAMGGAVTAAGSMAAWGVGQWGGRALMGLGTIGSMGVGLAASVVAEKVIGGGIERGNKIFGEVQDLGRIATAGRGMTLGETHEFGRGFRGMAKRMGVSTGEVRDIVAGIRQQGMMPPTRDVQQSLQQFESMAKDIRDIAVGMQTSLANATRMLKDVERLGMGRGAGGVFAAAGMAGRLGTSLGGLINYVGQGQQMGMATGIGAGAGGQLALGSAFAGAAGMGALTGGEQRMVGGALGLGRAFQRQALQNALGPWGQIQGMAMMGPTGAQPLPGTMMGTISQAAGNIFGGGDPIANMVEFQTGRHRMLGQMGGRGIRMMQAQAIQTQAEMLRTLSPNLTQERALQWSGMQQGLNTHQARAMAGFIQRGFRDPAGPSAMVQGMPGVFGGAATARPALRAAQETMMRSAYRDLQESSKMPWTRASDWIASKWSGMRQDMAERIDTMQRNALMEQGVVKPSAEAMDVMSNMMRTGRGAGVDMPLASFTGPASSQLQSVLAFSSTGTTGGTPVSVTSMRGQMMGLARNIHKASRLSTSNDEEMNRVSLAIGKSMDDGDFNAKIISQNIAANFNKMTKGGGKAHQARQWARAGIMKVFRSAGLKDYVEEFKDVGFAGKRGGVMIAQLQELLTAQGVKGDIGGSLQKMAAAGMGAAAYSMEAGESEFITKLVGGAGIDERARDYAIAARAIAERQRLGGSTGADLTVSEVVPYVRRKEPISAVDELFRIDMSRSEINIAKRGALTNPVTDQELAKYRHLAANDMKNTRNRRHAVRVVRSKAMRDYVKHRDLMYYKPYRVAAERVRKDPQYKKMSAEERSKKVRQIGDKLKTQATKYGKKHLETLRGKVMQDAWTKRDGSAGAARMVLEKMDASKSGKVVVDKVMKYAGISKAKSEEGKQKKGHRRRRRGRTVAFQGQQESFQSQVATALKKTAHVLDRISKQLPPKPQ